MNSIIINEEKCIGCSLCVNDCPGSCLYLESGKAHVYKSGCIECGHCYAICPKGAVTMAESLGLGVLYSGFFVMCTKFSRKLRKLIKLPKGQKAISCMVIGYPAVKYQRIVPRKGLKVKVL